MHTALWKPYQKKRSYDLYSTFPGLNQSRAEDKMSCARTRRRAPGKATPKERHPSSKQVLQPDKGMYFSLDQVSCHRD